MRAYVRECVRVVRISLSVGVELEDIETWWEVACQSALLSSITEHFFH